MGITVIPGVPDNNSSISKLKVKYASGEFETPNRMVTNSDLNAKSGIGADIPLTRERKIYLCELPISARDISDILNTNGFLAEVELRYNSFLTRTDTTGTMRVIFPKFTDDALNVLETLPESQKIEIWRFLFDLVDEISPDAFAIQYWTTNANARNYLDSQETPYIPVLDIKQSSNLTGYLTNLGEKSSSHTPFIGLTYSTYPRANLSYKILMERADKIHEGNKGIITFGSPRELGIHEADRDISALHYSNFLVADVSAERSYPGGGGKRSSARLFEKKDLAVPIPGDTHNEEEHFDELSLFARDRNLQEYFLSFVRGTVDMTISRAHYFSRVHENLVSDTEYRDMRAHIASHELGEYRKRKLRINKILDLHGL